MNYLNRKVALVTGSSKGIEAEIARQLADAEAAVILNYPSNKSVADKILKAIPVRAGARGFAAGAGSFSTIDRLPRRNPSMSACFPGFVSRRTDSPANCNRLTTLCRNMYLSSKLTRSTLAACLCLGLANPAYYLAAKFPGNFEEAVLHAINGGGQNQARAILTGALVGAQVGLIAIPKRFLDGLENSSELISLALLLGQQAEMDYPGSL